MKTGKEMSNECEKTIERLIEALEEQGSIDEAKWIEDHPDCEQDIKSILDTWSDLDRLPISQPAGDRNDRFFQMLTEFEDQQKTRFLEPTTLLKWVAIFVLGIVLGILISRGYNPDNEQTLASREDPLIHSLVSSSTTQRLQALQSIKDIEKPQEAMYEALYQTLINDPNVNVRLSTVEALVHFADEPIVRALLIKALSNQDSPIVQLMLADVIIKIQEEGTLEQLQEMMDKGELDNEVKLFVKENLNLL